jgi:hypothetical protein
METKQNLIKQFYSHMKKNLLYFKVIIAISNPNSRLELEIPLELVYQNN